MRPRIIMFMLVASGLLLVGCGEDGTSDATDATSSTTTSTTSTTIPESTSSTSPDSTSSTSSSTSSTSTSSTSSSTTSTTGVTTTTLPGEPFDIVPADGVLLAVIGVAFDDVLNVRSGPGTSFGIVATLAPTGTMLSTGEARLLTRSIWYRVSTGSVTGWVNSSFTGQLGLVDDVTSAVVADLGGIPEADTMLELGRIVAEARASVDPPSRITVTVAPTVGDLGEVTYDIVGVGDDAVLGERLHVFGQPTDSGDGFSLKSVESQVLCGRAVTDDGLCV